MPNTAIFDSVSAAWSAERAAGKKILDLSSGSGATSRMLAKLGYQVVATDYGPPPPMNGVARVAGVDLNAFPIGQFRCGVFGGGHRAYREPGTTFPRNRSGAQA